MLGINDFTLDDIKAIADVMSEKKLEKIELRNGDVSVIINNQQKQAVNVPPMPQQYAFAAPQGMPPMPPVQLDPMPVTANSAASDAKPDVESQTAFNGNVVKAPIVGTYYAAPAPGKAPFVTVGKKVSKGDVVMIIESMKLMNEITSEFDGVVEEILVKDGTPVEFDQAVMIIK